MRCASEIQNRLRRLKFGLIFYDFIIRVFYSSSSMGKTFIVRAILNDIVLYFNITVTLFTTVSLLKLSAKCASVMR